MSYIQLACDMSSKVECIHVGAGFIPARKSWAGINPAPTFVLADSKCSSRWWSSSARRSSKRRRSKKYVLNIWQGGRDLVRCSENIVR